MNDWAYPADQLEEKTTIKRKTTEFDVSSKIDMGPRCLENQKLGLVVVGGSDAVRRDELLMDKTSVL
jgi:hypothetical protein